MSTQAEKRPVSYIGVSRVVTPEQQRQLIDLSTEADLPSFNRSLPLE